MLLVFGLLQGRRHYSSKKLVQVWIAQGLVRHDAIGGEETMEEIALGYLEEMISRNMVQIKDTTKDDQVKTGNVQDIIRELSIAKAKEEINFEILREEGSSQSSHKPRHRAMYSSRKLSIDSTNQNKYLRSLFVHGPTNQYVDIPSSSYWKSLKLLKSLDFERCELEKFPDAISELTGLRYLGLRRTGIEKLPRSLGKLKNLQVLDLRGLTIREVSNFLTWKMYNLRHLHISSIWCKLPLKISTLKNLQTLSYVLLGDSDLEQLTKMISLRKLGVDLKEVSDLSKLFTSLATLENLYHLNLRQCGSLNMDGLSTLQHLTHLKLEREITKLPSASNFPPNLSYLSLFWSWLNQDPMPILEKLPKLLYLKLDFAYSGAEMVISHDGFPKLEQLYLKKCLNLSNVEAGEGAMPELKRVEIYVCPRLKIENLLEHMRSAEITCIN